jgi:hypothetical protein
VSASASDRLAQIAIIAAGLDADGLAVLYRTAMALAEAIPIIDDNEAPEAAPARDSKGSRAARGYLETKTINGGQYIYRRWRDNGRLRSEYVGKLRN